MIRCRSVLPVVLWALTAAVPLGAQAAADPLEARREDLRVFRTDFLARDRSYAPAARALADSLLARLEARLGEVSNAAFELELARIVALADNGHTNVYPSLRSVRYNRIPLRMVPFGSDFHVLRADTAHAALLGARLVAIDGEPIDRARAAARALLGGPDNWRDRHVPILLESPEQLHALGVAREPGSARYRFVLLDGSTTERVIAGEAADSTRDRFGSARWLFPGPLPRDQGRWRTLLAPDQAPWALQEAGVPFRWRMVPELETMVVELRQTISAANRPIEEFLAEVTREIRARSPRHLVLDLRANGGGNLNTTRAFVQELPSLVPGRVFVLTSPWTFSAAISTTGYLKQAAPDRVSIVGEMAGDRLEFWAEGRPIELPHSRVRIALATERHDYLHGCRAYSDCHGSVVRNPIRVSTFAPDVPAPWTIEDYRAGRDPAMEAVAALIRSRPMTP